MVILSRLRGVAAHAFASAMGQLAAEYASRTAAARLRYGGHELAAVLATLHSEQRAAEIALRGRLSAEARERRRAALAGLRGRGGVAYRQAATAITAAVPRPQRPRIRRADLWPLRRREIR